MDKGLPFCPLIFTNLWLSFVDGITTAVVGGVKNEK
jgi:hypothetical protein